MQTQTIEYYLRHSEDLAQQILDAWEKSAKPVSPELQSLFDKASEYLIAKRVAQKRQNDSEVSGADRVEEEAARLLFAKAYRRFEENRKAVGP